MSYYKVICKDQTHILIHIGSLRCRTLVCFFLSYATIFISFIVYPFKAQKHIYDQQSIARFTEHQSSTQAMHVKMDA